MISFFGQRFGGLLLRLGLLAFAFPVAAVEKPIGIFASAGAGGTGDNSIYGDAQVRGVLIRIFWSAIETQPGVWNFSQLDSQIANAKARGKSWSLGVLGGTVGTPAWLTDPTPTGLGAASYTYSRGKLPIFWDRVILDRMKLLANKLAEKYGDDASLKLVYITQMTFNGIEGHIQGVNMPDFKTTAGYTSEKWIAAAEETARNFASAFKNKALAFEVHELEFNDASVPKTIINDLWNDPSLDRRVGAAMWWISGRTNYQTNLVNALLEYPGDIYGQIIANSNDTSQFLNGDYTATFAQAKQLRMRYIEPWDFEFTVTGNSATSSNRKWDATFADFNTWADATFGVAPPAGSALRIATPPSNQTVAAGSNVVFAVVAEGSAPLTYQWNFNGTPIPGATGATLAIANAQPANAGAYYVSVTNTTGTIASSAAVLAIGSVSTAGRLTNLSILSALTGSGDTFTLGYVVGGAGTIGAKPLVIRAAGPSLAAFGVTNTLSDPKIETYVGSAKTGENDNWGGTPTLTAAMSGVGAFAYAGASSKDAAVATSIAPGSNSVKISGTGAGTVLAELYDATPVASFTSATSRLVNVSVLKPLGPGFTAGFVIGGGGAKTVLVRAVGPTLSSLFGIGDAVADPQLTLFSGTGKIGENNDWAGTPALTDAFGQVGAFRLAVNSKDAAILASLVPGSYTVQVSATDGSSGSVLLEIYEIP